MVSKILHARAFVLITLIDRHHSCGLPLSNKSVCEDTCTMLNVTCAYLDKIIDFMLEAGLATLEQRNLFLFLRLTPEGRAMATGGATPIVKGGGVNG
jgi:hypothetical protein